MRNQTPLRNTCSYGGWCENKADVYFTFKEYDVVFGVCDKHVPEYTRVIENGTCRYIQVTLDEALVIEIMKS
jgi:hypothetical protein